MRYERDEFAEAALGVFHGPLKSKEDTLRDVIVLVNYGPSFDDLVEGLNRVFGVHIHLRDHSGPLGRLCRIEDGAETR